MMQCPECPGRLVLKQIQWNDKIRIFYGCNRWPECKATHGAHPDGAPLGIPADKKTREYRNHLHWLAEYIWPWNSNRAKRKMYSWLKQNTESGHIGKMLMPELKDLETKLLKLIEERRQSGAQVIHPKSPKARL